MTDTKQDICKPDTIGVIWIDDLISRRAAIDHWRAIIDATDESNRYNMGFIDGLEFCISDLLTMPSAQQKQQWISCSKRLLKKAYGQYWVCTDTGYQCQCRWTDNVYGLGSSGEWAWKIFDIPQYSHVIAWMPLPEPYQEGEQNG